jgi:hypothetical protein
VTGVVWRGGPRRGPLVAAWVVLHRVTMQGGAPVDSARADARGRFSLVVGRPDTSAIYLASAWHHGVAYFSAPIPLPLRGRRAIDTLFVWDTTSTGPPLRVSRRLLTVARPKRDGTRDVLEIVELVNPDSRTHVSRDSVHPTWAGAIPAPAIQFQAGQGDFSAQAVARRDDSVLVFGPVQPGGPRQLTYGYVLPATEQPVAVPIDQQVQELDLLLEDTTAHAAAPAIVALGVTAIEDRRFARYRAGPVRAGAPVAIDFPRGAFRIEKLLPVIVVIAAAALIGGLVLALRRKDVRPQTSDVSD